MTPASTFLFPFEYTVWALPWSSIVCLEKINLNADFVYQIEFMHKAMCTYIFWHLFFCACGPSQHFHHHSCAINFSKHWYLYCVQNVLGYSMCSTVIILYQMILRVFLFIFLQLIWRDLVCDLEVMRDLITSPLHEVLSDTFGPATTVEDFKCIYFLLPTYSIVSPSW